MTIEAILARKGGAVHAIAADATLADAAALLTERRIGVLVVTGGNAVEGILSERDIVACVAREGKAALDRPVSAAMTAPAVTVAPATSVLAALSLMTKRRIRHLPVLDGGALAGLVSIGDLVKYRIDRIEAEAEAMRSYIQGA